MRIAVIGAGAIGGAVAAALVGAGHDVVVIARGQRLAALQAGPLRIEHAGGVEIVAVRALAPDAPFPPVDMAIICVKAPDLDDAWAILAGKLAGPRLVLTLQNGVEAHEIAAQALPQATILAGRVHGFFELVADAVRHTGVPPSILLGCTRGDAALAERTVAEAFAASPIPVEIAADIRRALWEKFLLSAGLGSVAAALDIPAGSVSDDPEGSPLLHAAMDEIRALAQHCGVPLLASDVAGMLAFAQTFPAGVTTSLQRDLAAGRPGEYDALTAAVGRIARRHGFALRVFPRIEAMMAARWPAVIAPR